MAQYTNDITLRYQTVQFSGSQSVSFGLVNEVKLSVKGVELGKDSFGRTVNGGFEVKGEFNVMQSDNDMLQTLYSAAANAGTGTLLFQGVGGDISIPDVIMNLDLAIAMDGTQSKLKVFFDRYMTAGELFNTLLTTETVSLPSIVQPPA